MHVGFITTEFVSDPTFAGGLANYLHRTSISLKQFGHTATVFVDSNSNEIINFNGINLVRVKAQKTWWYWFFNLITLYRLNPILLLLVRSYRLKLAVEKYNKVNKIDILQYSTTRSVGIFKASKIPNVVRISSYQKLIDEASGDKQNFRLWQKQLLQDIMLIRSKNLFGPSLIIGRYIEKKFRKKVSLIESPFNLDINIFDNSILNEIKSITNDNKYLLYFGSLSQLKGLLDIADIIYNLLDSDPKIFFVFIGKDIPVKGIPMLEKIKEKAGVHKSRIIWYYSLPHDKLYPIIQNAWIVVLPSRLDNFPNTCIEAMAFGKVVIGTYRTSFEQLIENDVSGFLCEPSNPESLLITIEKAIKLTPEDIESMGKKAKQRIALLKPEKVVKELLNYYISILNS